MCQVTASNYKSSDGHGDPRIIPDSASQRTIWANKHKLSWFTLGLLVVQLQLLLGHQLTTNAFVLTPTKLHQISAESSCPIRDHDMNAGLIRHGRNIISKTNKPGYAGRSTACSMSNESQKDGITTFENVVSNGFILLPFLSMGFPLLVQFARTLPPNSSEQLSIVALLFVSNRVYLYAMSTVVVALVACRGRNDDVNLGKRIVALTEELLYSPPLDRQPKRKQNDLITSSESIPGEEDTAAGKEEVDAIAVGTSTNEDEEFESSDMIKQLSSTVGESLDTVSSETQAIALPILVSVLLATSFAAVKFFNSADLFPAVDVDDGTAAALQDLVNAIKAYLPLLSVLWNAGILTLFSRSEIRRLAFSLNIPLLQEKKAELVPWILGFAITLGAYGGIWPAQNVVNMSLAILVGRGIQINKLSSIAGALLLLVAYDVSSVFLIQPAMASTLDAGGVVAVSDGIQTLVAADPSTAASSSAMGAVAVAKLTSQNFQPGLLLTKVGGRMGGALGLGDAVFPSILSTFCLRYDTRENYPRDDTNTNVPSLFAVSMAGYVAGCLACEFVPGIGTSGVPALLFILPSMLGSVVIAAALRGELGALWEFAPQDDDDGDIKLGGDEDDAWQ